MSLTQGESQPSNDGRDRPESSLDGAGTTLYLLRRWRAGDDDAINELLKRHLPAIHARVHRLLGKELRQHANSEDIVHEVVIDLLKYLPQFHISVDSDFQAFVAKITINVIRDHNEWLRAACRDIARTVPISPDIVLDLDPPVESVPTPSQMSSDREWEAWVRLALMLVEPEDRRIIWMKTWRRSTFRAIGEELGVSEEAARKRYGRAFHRLEAKVQELRARGIDGEDLEDGGTPIPS